MAQIAAAPAAAEPCLFCLCGTCVEVFALSHAPADIHLDLVLGKDNLRRDADDVVRASAAGKTAVERRCPKPPAKSCRTKRNVALMVWPSFCTPCTSMELVWSSTSLLESGQGTTDPGCDAHQELNAAGPVPVNREVEGQHDANATEGELWHVLCEELDDEWLQSSQWCRRQITNSGAKTNARSRKKGHKVIHRGDVKEQQEDAGNAQSRSPKPPKAAVLTEAVQCNASATSPRGIAPRTPLSTPAKGGYP